MSGDPERTSNNEDKNRGGLIGRRGAMGLIAGSFGIAGSARVTGSHQTSYITQEVTLSEGQDFEFTHTDGRGVTEYNVEVLDILDNDAVRMRYSTSDNTETFTADKRGETLNEQARIHLTGDAQTNEEGQGEATFKLEYQQSDRLLDALDPRQYR